MASTGSEISRRAWLRQTGIGLAAGAALDGFAPWSAAAATSAPNAKELAPLNRFPRAVQEYLIRRVREIEDEANARRAALRTRGDAERHVADVREKIQRCFGPWPEKTPLNARITGVIERDAYRIEKVIFESRIGFLVTANFYVPKGRAFPLPAVVGTCGHSGPSKAAVPYQSFAQGLARQGYVVLIYDPIGQAERLQYLDEKLAPKRGDYGVSEHIHDGDRQLLVGEVFGAWRAWDGIRALDYLLTRTEVDPHHVGITGNSGGGTMTTWLAGLDRRWTMAAPSCFVTTFRRNLENELPADCEQYPPGALALGLDHEDFIAAMAPRPVILLGQEKDYFDRRGLEAAYARLRRLYGLLGAEENIRLFVGPDPHGYSKANREAMYQWFNYVTKISAEKTEPALTLEADPTLQCTPRGQVLAEGSKTVFGFARERADALHRARGTPRGEALRRAVATALNLPPREGVPEHRILRPAADRRYPKPHAGTYAVETEPGVFALVYRLHDEPLFTRPPRTEGRVVLYVSHRSADDELRTEPLLAELVRATPQEGVFTCDVRGIGESQPVLSTRPAFEHIGADFFHAWHGVMLGYSSVAQRTYDVLRVLDWLAALGQDEVHLVARGWGAVPATFAAVLSERVREVTLKHAPLSYADICATEDYRWPVSTFLPGALEAFDLPDCYAELRIRKKLRQIEPMNGAGKIG